MRKHNSKAKSLAGIETFLSSSNFARVSFLTAQFGSISEENNETAFFVHLYDKEATRRRSTLIYWIWILSFTKIVSIKLFFRYTWKENSFTAIVQWASG